MEEFPDRAIDIAQVIRSRTGMRRVPGWMVRIAGKIFHIDEINSFLVKGYDGVEFCEQCLHHLDIKVECRGLENISDTQGRLTFVSNHPLGGIDGVALIGMIGKHCKGGIKLIVNDFLMSIKAIGDISVPVNKMGAQKRDLKEKLLSIYSSDDNILVFPSGKCSRKIGGHVQDPPWRKSFVTMSAMSGRKIVPVHFIGENSARFYRVSSLFEKLHIRFNIGMMMLPDEMFRSRGKTFSVVFGSPICVEDVRNGQGDAAVARLLREMTYNLK